MYVLVFGLHFRVRKMVRSKKKSTCENWLASGVPLILKQPSCAHNALLPSNYEVAAVCPRDVGTNDWHRLKDKIGNPQDDP